MKRIPAIHIKVDKLEIILKDLLEEDLGKRYSDYYKNLVNDIALQSKRHQLQNRKILVSTKKIEKKVIQSQESTYELAGLFNKLLIAIRRKKRHQNISPIKEGSKDWLFIKELSGGLNDFLKSHHIETREGFVKYLNLALDRMTKFSIYKMRSMNESIYDCILAQKEIEEDDSPKITESLYLYYSTRISERTGINYNYHQFPEKYVYFIRCKEEALRIGANPKAFIIAQFEGMEYRNGIPDPLQLVGPKALERYTKYAYENSIKVTDSDTENLIDFSKIFKK